MAETCNQCDDGLITELVCCGVGDYTECCGCPDVIIEPCQTCEGTGMIKSENKEEQSNG